MLTWSRVRAVREVLETVTALARAAVGGPAGGVASAVGAGAGPGTGGVAGFGHAVSIGNGQAQRGQLTIA